MQASTQPRPSGNLIKLKVPALYVLLSYAIGFCAVILIRNYYVNIIVSGAQPGVTVANDCVTNMKQIRLSDGKHQLTRPLLLTDITEESKELAPLKQQITAIVKEKISTGFIIDASVYVRKLTDGSWIDYNPYKTFTPGSLLKVPTIITYLKQSETEPGLLDKTIFFNESILKQMPAQTYNTTEIKPGKSYTIRELIYQTMVNSDNHSTFLLNANMNIPVFYKLFADLGFATPNLSDKNYQITSADYSKFIRILFNSSYLSRKNSEYALDLLSKSTFADGLTKYIPKDVAVAHKFGEYGFPSNVFQKQLHESGIVYLNNAPYIITIFTGGNQLEDLPPVIATLSKTVYDYMAALDKTAPAI